MGKLVLFLADGTTMDVPLDKERLTIGRRPDNDVCLPYPAVSGEHAAVVTILADSFLEDLGSTNGTLVNSRPVAKHFLRDHDQIDIGRQRLTYVSDNDARVEPLLPDVLRSQIRGLTDQVVPARVPVAEPRVGGGTSPVARARDEPLLADLDRAMESAEPDLVAPAVHEAPPAPAAPIADTGGAAARASAPAVADLPPTPERAVRKKAQAPVAPVAPPPPPAPRGTRIDTAPMAVADGHAVAPPAAKVPSIRVLSGASLGRSVPFPNDELSLGRVGVQVAMVRKVGDGFRLIPIEGPHPPRINGAPVPPDGAPVHPGDTFEVAGIRLELSVPG